jgi:hypothetical protein
MKQRSTRISFRLALTTFCIVVGVPMMNVGASVASASTPHIAPCKGNNLWGAYVGRGAATGHFIYTIALINVGHTTCKLSGYPNIQGIRDNRTYTLDVNKHGTFAGNLPSTVLSPRISGELLLSTADDCNALNTGGITKIDKVAAANTYTNLTIELPNSNGDVYLSGIKVDIACGLEISQLGWKGN